MFEAWCLQGRELRESDGVGTGGEVLVTCGHCQAERRERWQE